MTTESREQDPGSARASRKSRGSPAIIEAGGAGAWIDFEALVGRFLSWPVPPTECADPCASMTDYPYPRNGTSFLSADGARKMLEHVLRTGPALGALDAVTDWYKSLSKKGRESLSLEDLHRLSKRFRALSSEAELMPLLASAWLYGGFRAETDTERRMQDIMERCGWWPIKNEAQMIAALDALDTPPTFRADPPPRDIAATAELHRLRRTLKLAYELCLSAAPKQAVGEVLAAALSSQHNADDGGEAVHSSPATDEQP